MPPQLQNGVGVSSPGDGVAGHGPLAVPVFVDIIREKPRRSGTAASPAAETEKRSPHRMKTTKKMTGKRLAAALVILLFYITAGAARAQEVRMTLREAVAAALEGNHGLRAALSSAEAEGEGVGVARSALLPSITFEERYTRSNNPTAVFSAKLNQERFTSADFAIESLNHPDPVNDYQTSISVEQPLYVRKAHVGLDMAKRSYSASLEELKRERESVAFDVAGAYLRARAAREFVTVAEKGVEDAGEHLRIARVRFEEGLGLYSDVLRATTGLRAAEQRLVTAEKNFRISKRALGLLMGRDGDVAVADEEVDLVVRDIDHYIDASLSRNDLRSMELRAENARKAVKLARSAYFPMVAVGGKWQMNDHEAPFSGEGDSWTVSAFLRWEIFDGTLRRHESKRARHKARAAAERLEGLRKAVSFQVYEKYLAVEEAKKNMELAEAALVSAREGERLVRARYENSLSPIVDLLDAELSLNQARANHVMKKNEYLISVAALGYESGTILADLGVE